MKARNGPTWQQSRLLDPDHDREAEFLLGLPPLPVQDVLLRQAEERLHRGVVRAGPDPAHRSA